MCPLSGKRIQKKRKRRDERLAFTGRHFGDASEMQLDTTHQLHVVVHHVPLHLPAGDHDGRTEQASRRFANGREGFRQKLVEHFSDGFAKLAFDAAASIGTTQLYVDGLPLCGVGSRLLLFLQLGDTRFELAGLFENPRPEFRGLAAKLFLGHRLKTLVLLVDLIDDWLNTLLFAVVPRSEDIRQHTFQHSRFLPFH